jgi:outer membrane protein assembly factor BamB
MVAFCLFPDLDFGSSPNLFRAADGHQVVAAGQASGIFHAVSTATMQFDWTSRVGPPTIGARAGAAAYDGTHLYAATGFPGVVWALNRDSGTAAWVAPTIGGNQFNPIAHANGVVYTLAAGDAPISAGVATIGGAMPTGPAILQAFSADSGALLVSKPLALATGDVSLAPLTGGVVVARHTVYVPSNTAAGASHIVACHLP